MKDSSKHYRLVILLKMSYQMDSFDEDNLIQCFGFGNSEQLFVTLKKCYMFSPILISVNLLLYHLHGIGMCSIITQMVEGVDDYEDRF